MCFVHLTYVIIESAPVDSPSGSGSRRTSVHDFVTWLFPPKHFLDYFDSGIAAIKPISIITYVTQNET